MNVSEFSNPYDFANPVNDSDLFVGRTGEMDEIKYYLDHAAKASRPINLAILGARTSGKTSVLNMIEIEARRMEICVVRVDLDEADAETQLVFFYKIFDSLLMTACSLGAYGGLEGQTYQCYRTMVDAYEIPDDKLFCPFTFPMQYANAMKVGNASAALSDTGFKRDMADIREHVNRPIALLFDECDVLAKSRVHLQKLRNIFMNTPGFMLVITGTPALFPLMDEVFSPIIRQFKKIHIGPFEEQDETEDCIRKPLEKIGITHPSKIFNSEPYGDLEEIHNLSGGRPYDIQLICHSLFRRIQDGRAKRMELTLDVLDDLRKELEAAQDVSLRPVLAAIRNFNTNQLSALKLICACDAHATLEQLWFAEYVFRGEKEWTKESLEEHLREFEELGVVTTKNDLITFAGEDFDRIYCRYFAKRRGVLLDIRDLPYEIFLNVRLVSFLATHAKGIQRFPLLRVGAQEEPKIEDIAVALSDESTSDAPFQSAPGIAEIVYWSSLKFRHSDHSQVAAVTIVSPWITVRRWYGCEDPKGAIEGSLDDLISILAGPAERAVASGGDLKVQVHTLPLVPLQSVARKIEQSDNIRMKKRLSGDHLGQMVEAYTERHDVDEAVLHGELGYRYHRDPRIANNLGYLFLVSDNLDRARQLLGRAATDYEEPERKALPNYNLGVVDAKEGRVEDALVKFNLAIEQIQPAEESERKCACLVLPYIAEEEQKLEFREVSDPDLLETAQAAASAIQELLGKE